MCGIFAILFSEEASSTNLEQIKPFFNKGSKRGPESSNFTMITQDVLFGFHRLAINGLNTGSDQPITSSTTTLICNGEIYNHKELFQSILSNRTTDSDCEAVSKAYEQMGTHCANLFDGVFAFLLFDHVRNCVIVGRDPYGVRPLYVARYRDGTVAFASDVAPLYFNRAIVSIEPFLSGTIATYQKVNNKYTVVRNEQYFHHFFPLKDIQPIEHYMKEFYTRLCNAVRKRVENCERPIAALLSGGLDSSIVSALVARYYSEKTGHQVATYSVGLEGGEDLKFAKQVARHIHSDHTEVIATHDEFIDSIPNVIRDVESYDTTTVRASVGNWYIGKYIKSNSDAKVVFNGDGADELMGGYLYFTCAPNHEEFDQETRRLLGDINRFDVLRSDKSISSHGLEPRTPFLDKELTRYYLSIPIEYRNHAKHGDCEKYFIRKTIEQFDPDLLPQSVLWRRKEAFSDGVSSQQKSWYEIINESLHSKTVNTEMCYEHNPPKTKEQRWYREIYETLYPNAERLIPYFWMPRFVEGASDASARTLSFY